MFYVIDPDTILVIVDASGLNLTVESYSSVKAVVESADRLTLNIDTNATARGLNEDDVVEIIRSENMFANYKTQDIDDVDPILYVGKLKPGGEWLLEKYFFTGDDAIVTYANLSNNPSNISYTSAWTGRLVLNYTLISNLTGL